MMRLLFALFLLLTGCSFGKPSLVKKVILDVSGHQMTAEKFSQELAYKLKGQDALSAKDPKVVAEAKARIVQDFIVQVLAQEWAKDHGAILKAEDLEQQIQSIQKSYPDDLTFQQALADEGTTFREWRERLQASLLQKLVIQKVVDGVTPPSEAEALAYYQEHKSEFAVPETAQIRQILTATEADAKIMEAELKKGKRIADLAKAYSISPEASQGGNVGWIEKGLSDVFEPAFRMKTGQRSPIVKSSFGYHIFEVVGRKTAHNRPYPDVKADVRRILMEKREQAKYLSWLEEQTRKARVFKDQAFIDALKVETKLQ